MNGFSRIIAPPISWSMPTRKMSRSRKTTSRIILNISPVAVQNLVITNEGIEFNGRFGGIPTRVYVPTQAVLGIYAKENGQGMIFDTDDPIPEPPGPGKKKLEEVSKDKAARPSLRIVKS